MFCLAMFMSVSRAGGGPSYTLPFRPCAPVRAPEWWAPRAHFLLPLTQLTEGAGKLLVAPAPWLTHRLGCTRATVRPCVALVGSGQSNMAFSISVPTNDEGAEAKIAAACEWACPWDSL
jgi:hypothetical protein